MAPKLLFFIGPPNVSSLKWDEKALVNTFIEPIARFAGLEQPQPPPVTLDLPTNPQSPQAPAWRSLPLQRSPFAILPTTFPQDWGENSKAAYTKAPAAQPWLSDSRGEGPSFFTTSQVDSYIEEEYSQTGSGMRNGEGERESFKSTATESRDDVLSQFYEESYAVHEAIVSSQAAPSSPSSPSQTTTTTTNSSLSTSNSNLSTQSRPHSQSSASQPLTTSVPKPIPIAGKIHNLKDLPNATYLSSLNPQTMTVTLIVGLLSSPSTRLIRTKRGVDVELTELLVGDETKTGFGINFWLPPSPPSPSSSSRQNPPHKNQTAKPNPKPNPADENTRHTLESLRPQDVILIQNVALSHFRGKVYGQSLHRRDITKLHLLYRNHHTLYGNRLDGSDIRGCHSTPDFAAVPIPAPTTDRGLVEQQREKTRRVKEWVDRFVGVSVGDGGGGARGRGRGMGKNGEKGKGDVEEVELLPEDTQ